MRMRFGFLAFVLLIILAALSFSSLAQTPQPTPSNSGREFFTLGGRNDHVYVYPEAQKGLTAAIRESLSKSMLVYQPLFSAKTGISMDAPFQIVVFFQADPKKQVANTIAQAGILTGSQAIAHMQDIYPLEPILDPQVCFIEIFNLYLSETKRESEIAHEFAHCYQSHYHHAGFTADRTKRMWWVEGGAEWLASLVYPDQFPHMLHNSFRYDRSTLIRQYTNLHFWAWVAGPEGLGSNEALVNYFLNMPADPAEYPGYLTGITGVENSVDFNHKWLLALFEGRVPFRPNMGLAGTVYENASSGSVRLSTVRFAGDHAVISGIKVNPGSRAVVTLTNGQSNLYGVSIKIGGRWTRIHDRAAVDFCPEGGKLDVLYSRADAITENDRTPFTLTFTQDPSPSNPPCDQAATPVPANCIVGEWVVTEYPVTLIGDSEMVVDMSDYRYYFNADGSYRVTYEVVGIPGDGSHIHVNIPFTGRYAVTRKNGSTTDYLVSAFSLEIQPGGSVILTTKSGEKSDVTKSIYNAINQYGQAPWVPDAELYCAGDVLSWTSSADLSWYLQRINR